MSGISSGIGLISGINTADLIDQLMAIDRQPILTLQSRVEALGTQRSAFMGLSAQLLGIQNSILGFGRDSFFRQFSSTTTHDDILTASADATASPGSFTFRVRSLATTHAVISRGFADADNARVGTGTLNIEVGHGSVQEGTPLDALNGGAGVPRGIFTITDRSGDSAEIDLSMAMSVGDVLDAINDQTGIRVRASVTGLASNGSSGDRIVIEDLSGGSGSLIVADLSGGSTANALGIASVSSGPRIDGSDLIRLTSDTQLSMLNDGNDVACQRGGTDLIFTGTTGTTAVSVSLTDILSTQPDTDLRILNGGNGVRLGTIRITDRTGATAELDLSSARTARDIVEAVNGTNLAVTLSIQESHFELRDTSKLSDDTAKAMKIEDLTGFTATDLGLAQEVDGDGIVGPDVYRISTIQDVINAINFAPNNDGALVVASLSADGKGLSLKAMGFNTVTVTAAPGSNAARDLGILDAEFSGTFNTHRLLGGLNTVLLRSLNGGQGVNAGIVRITDRAGSTSDVDLSSAKTLQDAIDLINANSGTQLVASVNTAGNGLMLRDESGAVGGAMAVEDVTGSLAADLGLIAAASQSSTKNVLDGGNAQRQYISERTLVSSLNAGRGVSPGTFQITDSTGATFEVPLDDTLTTVGELINRINSAIFDDSVEARINDTGDGIVVIDKAGGPHSLTIEDRNGGRAAADLRLVGTAGRGEDQIDGSFEIHIDIDADDTLNDVAAKINSAGLGFTASVLEHGGVLNRASLSITSDLSGHRGKLMIDSVGLDMAFSTLSAAQDAVIAVGEDATTNPVLVSGSSNTMDGVVKGVTLNLLSVSDKPVTVSIAQDVESVLGSIDGFVQAYNGVLDTIADETSYNADTQQRGTLLGDPTVNRIRSRLVSLAIRKFEGVDASVSRLFNVGIRAGAGGRLQFDKERFREVLAESPQQVEELFTKPETGVAAVLKEMVEQLTRSFDGMITQKDNLLTDQQELLNERIDHLTGLLATRRSRLEAQFVGLESSLAALQSQQSSLAALASIGG